MAIARQLATTDRAVVRSETEMVKARRKLAAAEQVKLELARGVLGLPVEAFGELLAEESEFRLFLLSASPDALAQARADLWQSIDRSLAREAG